VKHVVVEKNRAKYGSLGLEIVRKGPFGDGDVRHGRNSTGKTLSLRRREARRKRKRAALGARRYF